MNTSGDCSWFALADLQRLLASLQQAGFRTVGPQVRDGAVIYADLPDASALPTGVLDEQEKHAVHLCLIECEDRVAGLVAWDPEHEPGADTPRPRRAVCDGERGLAGGGHGHARAAMNSRWAAAPLG